MNGNDLINNVLLREENRKFFSFNFGVPRDIAHPRLGAEQMVAVVVSHRLIQILTSTTKHMRKHHRTMLYGNGGAAKGAQHNVRKRDVRMKSGVKRENERVEQKTNSALH